MLSFEDVVDVVLYDHLLCEDKDMVQEQPCFIMRSERAYRDK